MRVVPEMSYYGEQTKTAQPIRFAGNVIATVMSIGAVLAAMNTMYASVGARTREIGTLRVLGFRRRAVVSAILIEGACLALVGGVIGGAFSLPLDGYKTGTFNFQTFSETVFELTITAPVIGQGSHLRRDRRRARGVAAGPSGVAHAGDRGVEGR